ncbi:MAG: hypothetical protein ACLRWL_05585 [Evtepia gabavorous]
MSCFTSGGATTVPGRRTDSGYSGADEEPVYRPAPAQKMKGAPAQGTMLDALLGADRPGSSAPWC